MSTNALRRVGELRKLYRKGVNIMQYLRDEAGISGNELDAILVSYDLQTGSYIEALSDPSFREYKQTYNDKVTSVLQSLAPTSVLEVGVGEGTTLFPVVEKLSLASTAVFGYDISWSRVFYARDYAKEFNQQGTRLFVGDLFETPLLENSMDVVFTSHTISPNVGKERAALEELYRVTGRYLILLEPSWEFGDTASRENMERHQYCRGLRDHADALGYKIVDYRLFDNSNPGGDTEILVIEKGETRTQDWERPPYACPVLKTPLQHEHGHYYSEDSCLVFPELQGIPCLLSSSAILATKYLEPFQKNEKAL